MKYLLLIIGLVLWVGIRSRKAVQKQLSDLEDAANRQQTDSRPAFESLFEDRKVSNTSFAEEEKAAGYFTYETQPVYTAQTVASAKESTDKAKNVVLGKEEESAGSGFDLRQAIVYSTILRAKYIPETNNSVIN